MADAVNVLVHTGRAHCDPALGPAAAAGRRRVQAVAAASDVDDEENEEDVGDDEDDEDDEDEDEDDEVEEEEMGGKEEEVEDDDKDDDGLAVAGAQWEIFCRDDVYTLTEWLHRMWDQQKLDYHQQLRSANMPAGHRGCASRVPDVHVQVHPIHDQANFLTSRDLAMLYEDTGIRPW
jgi:hypothetical protein